MHRIFARACYTLGAMIVLTWLGCGEDVGDPEPAALVAVSPRNGSTVYVGAAATLTFASDPGVVTANSIATLGAGAIRTFAVGSNDVQSIAWSHGGTARVVHVVLYTIFHGDATPPVLQSVDPDIEGSWVVDPGDLADGIALTFDEPVNVVFLDLTERGEQMEWVPTSDGRVVTLHANPDWPVVTRTEYEVRGAVTDVYGNETEVHIWFMTKWDE